VKIEALAELMLRNRCCYYPFHPGQSFAEHGCIVTPYIILRKHNPKTGSAMNQATSSQHGDEPLSFDRTGRYLLSLDGGGVRGLSTLYILKIIMDRMNLERGKNGLPSAKPCEVFDLIGGTSTGG